MLFLLVVAWNALARGAVYVSPAGSDAADGSMGHPVATLEHARDLCRMIPPGQPRELAVMDGDYFNVNLKLDARDSGLTIAAVPGAKPRLYGGVRLNDWQPDGPKFYAAKLPAGMDPAVQPRMLEIDGAMAARSRLPETGTFTHTSRFDVAWLSTTGGGWQRKPTTQELTTLRYLPSDLGPWLEPRNAEITVYHMWDESTVGVASIGASNHLLTLTPECGYPPGAFNVHTYVLWNLREGMLRPGQWYHDRVGGRLVYWPLPGQDMSKVTALVPTTLSVIKFGGTPEAAIHDVAVKGLSIHLTSVPLVSGGEAADHFDGAVALEYAHHCLLSGLEVSRVAAHTISGRNDLRDVTVENCRISQCGGGGIYVGDSHAIIRNNRIESVGLMFPSAVGIYRGGDHCLISHNLVHDCTYCGINFGGSANVIESNRIYDCMKSLRDGGAIYCFAGRDCILRNNVYVVPDGDARFAFARSAGFRLEKNIIWARGKLSFSGIDAVTEAAGNVFYSASGQIVSVHLNIYNPTSQVPGIFGDNATTDPLFVNLERDWHFAPDSAAAKYGIVPLDVSAAGPEER